jgi:DNA transformation protein
MNKLEKLPNIGKILAEKINKTGVKTEDELKMIGSKQTFMLIRSFDKDACIDMLYAIEGAIQGVRWHSLSKETKDELKSFVNELRRNGL